MKAISISFQKTTTGGLERPQINLKFILKFNKKGLKLDFIDKPQARSQYPRIKFTSCKIWP